MKKIKVFALLATLFVGVFSNLLAPTVHAAEGDVTITLHKVKDYTGDIENTGDILTGPFNFLPGITFDAYDVTEEYYTAYNAYVADNPDKLVSDAITAAVTAVQGAAPSGKAAVATKETDTYGSATFSLNAKSGMTTGTTPVPRDAVYLFVEQASDGVTTIADNLVVSLPIYKQGTNDTVLTNIHLYPKNITKETPFDKEITSQKDGVKQTDFSIGQTINYQLKTTIPADIAATKLVEGQAQKLYNVFQFVDTFKTDQLTFIENTTSYSVTVTDGTTGTILTTLTSLTPADYTVNVATVAGTTTVTTALTAAGIDKLATHANKEITFDYQMKINSLEYIDTPIVNEAKAIFGNDGTTVKYWNKETKPDREEVYTGGFKFVKVDVNNNAKTLAGAEFVVRKDNNDTAKYFKATAEGGQWVDTYKDATKYTTDTDTDGIVEVKGLEYGTYYLEETLAPTDYVKLSARIPFTVAFDSYKITTEVANTPKGFLPQTGGAGIILFVALGAAMVGLAGVYFTSRRKVA